MAEAASYELVVMVDGDTVFEPDAVRDRVQARERAVLLRPRLRRRREVAGDHRDGSQHEAGHQCGSSLA